MVRVRIGRGRVVVDDLDRFDVHGERSLAEISLTTGPFDGTFTVAGVATGPDANLDAHGRLREVGTTDSIGILESPYGVAIDIPNDGSGGPDDRISVDRSLGAVHIDKGGSVVSACVTLAKVVSLNLSGITPKRFLYVAS